MRDDKICDMTEMQVNNELIKLETASEWKYLTHKVEELSRDFCNSRTECARLDIPYTDIRDNHVLRAKLAAWVYLIGLEKIDEDM